MECNKVSFTRKSPVICTSQDKYKVKETNFQSIFECSDDVSTILSGKHVKNKKSCIFLDSQSYLNIIPEENQPKSTVSKIPPILSNDKLYANFKPLAFTNQASKIDSTSSMPHNDCTTKLFSKEKLLNSRSHRNIETPSNLQLPNLSSHNSLEYSYPQKDKLPEINSPYTKKRMSSNMLSNTGSLSFKKEIPLYGGALKKFAISKKEICSMKYTTSMKHLQEINRDSPIDFKIKKW